MVSVVLYAALLGIGLALSLLLLGFGCWQLGVTWLAGWSYSLAENSLLLAFALLMLWLLSLLFQAIFSGIKTYFQPKSRLLRRLVMLQVNQHVVGQKLMLEKRQLHYLTQLKQQRLLAVNNKKHSRVLFKAIRAELQDVMTPGTHKALKQYHKQANPHGMLALRNKIVCQTSINA